MILAYLESTALRVARIVNREAPLMAPERTVEPGVLDLAIHGANLVGEEDQEVSGLDGLELQVLDRLAVPSMGHRGHPAGQGIQDRGGPPHGEILQGRSSGEHQDHQGPGQVFPQQQCGQDGEPGQKIGAKLSSEGLAQQLQDQWNSTKPEDRVQRGFKPGTGKADADHQMGGDSAQCEERDGQVSPAPPVQRRHGDSLRPGPF
jgi:hypothetical protein